MPLDRGTAATIGNERQPWKVVEGHGDGENMLATLILLLL